MPHYETIVPYDWESRQPWLDIDFPVTEYEDRVARVRALMQRDGLDCLLAFGGAGGPANVRYLSNFEPSYGDNVVVVPRDGDLMLTTNWIMHGEPMHTSIWMTWIKDVRPGERAGMARDPVATVEGQVAERLHESNLAGGRIGLAGLDAASAAFVWRLQAALPDAQWVPADGLLLEVRAIKGPLEIAAMREAARIAGEMNRVAVEHCRAGVSEWEVAGEAHRVCFAQGGELSFPSAVTAGPRAGLKHCAPTSRRRERGDRVFIDMAARFKGYYADFSRCTVVGTPDAELQKMLDTALEMFIAVVAAIRPGVFVPDLHTIANDIARKAGYDREIMPKGFGHGLGTSLFERPDVRIVSETILQPGMIFALEPMLIRHGFGTAVVEETVLVTSDGCELMSGSPLATW
jgi:Xaa-Pro aminopeptidase